MAPNDASLAPVQDSDQFYASPPPPFGRALLEYFGFEKGYINLNHGSYGSLPSPLFAKLYKLSELIESNPDRFLRIHYAPRLSAVRGRLAELINARKDEVVMVPNATHGVNTVVRNLQWEQGDAVVGTTVTYGAVTRTLAYVTDTPPYPKYHTFQLNYPTTNAETLSSFREFIKTIRADQLKTWDASSATRKPRLLVVIDAITSNPGILLPWEEMVRICQEVEESESPSSTSVHTVTNSELDTDKFEKSTNTILTLVDAAHAIGQIRSDVTKSGCDFWVSNCHKWLYAKRGCAILFVPRRNQHLIRTSIPTSFFYLSPKDVKTGTETFVAQFAWTGTHDPVPYLSTDYALDFRAWLGGEDKINEYCHNLAVSGGRKLAKTLGTHVMNDNGQGTNDDIEGVANMVNVQLPLSLTASSASTVKQTLERALLEEYNCYAAHFWHNGAYWARCSAQVWNEESDFEYLGKALLDICARLEKAEKEKGDKTE